jgi:hypothetical protein
MNEMIESWKTQSHQIPLYISVCIDENLKTIFNHYLETKWKINDLTFFVSEEIISQFQHYKKLCEILIEKYNKNTWIVFTDDDDIWDKDRILYFKTLVDNLKKLNKENSVSHIQIPTHCVNYKDDFDDTYEMRNLNHIEVSNINSSHQHLDYWQFSCQLKYLKDFIENCNEELLNDGYCNLYFVKYFYNTKTPAYRWYTKDKSRFVYYWRGMAGGENPGSVHLLEKLKKKSPEESMIKIFLQEGCNTMSIKNKNKEVFKKYIEKYSNRIKNFNKNIIKQEIYNLFYTDKYNSYINSPTLEGVIQ